MYLSYCWRLIIPKYFNWCTIHIVEKMPRPMPMPMGNRGQLLVILLGFTLFYRCCRFFVLYLSNPDRSRGGYFTDTNLYHFDTLILFWSLKSHSELMSYADPPAVIGWGRSRVSFRAVLRTRSGIVSQTSWTPFSHGGILNFQWDMNK